MRYCILVVVRYTLLTNFTYDLNYGLAAEPKMIATQKEMEANGMLFILLLGSSSQLKIFPV